MTGSNAPCCDPLLVGIDAALAADDLDRAMALGLCAPALDAVLDLAAKGCPACRLRAQRVAQARDARQRALAARERFRAREARLQQRAAARAQRRAPPPAAVAQANAAALPAAAAAALARAKAKAAAKRND